MSKKVKRSKKIVKVENLEEALNILLGKIGNSMNAAYIFGDAKDYSLFIYESMIYPRPDFKIPLQPLQLRRFFYELFNPSLYKENPEMNSIIRVSKLDCRTKNNFRLNMLLYLKREVIGLETKKVLTSYSDSVNHFGGTCFNMD